MAAYERRTSVPLRAIASASCILLLFIAGSAGICSGSGRGITTIATAALGWGQPRLVSLPAGMQLSDKPPEGWSHLVIKTIPRLATGDRGTLPAGSSRTATLFRTAILADVQPLDVDEKDWVLARIGVGMCYPEQDHDIVITSDRLEALGIRLSMVERMVLDAAEAEVAEGRVIARTPTFALFRGPAILVVGGKHRKISLCYAFCVERTTGKLGVAAWAMLPESEPQQPPLALVKLGANLIYDCQLDVRAKRILNSIPISWSFAMRSLPPGRSLRVPPVLGQLIATTAHRPGDVDPEELERLFGTVLFDTVEGAKTTVRQTLSSPAAGAAR